MISEFRTKDDGLRFVQYDGRVMGGAQLRNGKWRMDRLANRQAMEQFTLWVNNEGSFSKLRKANFIK